MDLTALTMDELVEAYNAAPKPNEFGKELLDRVHAADRAELGMSADNPRLRITERKERQHRGVTIFPRNYCGMYSAILPNGPSLAADTVQGMRALISHHLNHEHGSTR